MRYSMVLLIAVSSVALCGEKKVFLTGGDISMLSRIEELGGAYSDKTGKKDMIKIMMDHGCNCFRLRLFVNPNKVNAVVNDLPYTLKLGERVKKAGGKLLLDFHYSDTWADPGKQTKPAEWAKLDFDSLEKKVEEYTAGVIAQFARKKIMPDIVQIGNEIAPGILWPDGKLAGEDKKQWDRFTRLLKAGIRGVKKSSTGVVPGIMIHIHKGGSTGGTRWFYDRVIKHDVSFDIIGLSYYPWWHGSIADLKKNLKSAAKAYGKDIVVVETAYPYRGAENWKKKENIAWPVSPEGQAKFLSDVVKTVRATPDGLGTGVIWWYPESIPVNGLKVWNGGSTALFDSNGKVLPAMNEFKSPN